MATKTTRFSKTYQPKKRRKGPTVKSQVRKLLAGLANEETIENAKAILDELMNDFLNARSIHIRFAAWKECMKYVYAQKKSVDVTSQGNQLSNSAIFIIPAFKEIQDDNN